MKLRILNDSVRLRLGQGEVARLQAGEAVEAACRFPDGSVLVYGVQPGPGPAATFEQGRIQVSMPADELARWCREDVSWRARLDTGDAGLELLVEKDFQCLTPRDEDESDLYPHPDAHSE